MSGTKVHSNYEDLLTFTRASKGHALRPVSYGSEEITNGGFDTDSGWVKQTGWSISSGTANWDGVSSVYLQQADVFTPNTLYTITFTISNNTSGTISIRDGAATVLVPNTTYANGTYSFNVVSTSNTSLRIYGVAGTGSLSIDNVSVKEVTFDQPDGTLTLFEHPVNVPRVEWDSAGNRLGLLVEEARTNLFTYSEDFSNAAWIENNITAEASSTVTSPDQEESAYLLTTDAASFSYIELKAPVNSSTDYAISAFVKEGTHSVCWLYVQTGATYGWAYFDISDQSTQAVAGSSTTPSDLKIQDVGNGWYRVSAVFDITTGGASGKGFGISDAKGSTTVSAGKTMYLYGAQLEEGSFPTSYIKTTGSTATRSADVASIPVADFGFNTEASTFLVDFSHFGDTAERVISLSDGTVTNQAWLRTATATDFIYQVYTAGGYVAQLDTTSARDSGYKAAAVLKKDDFAVSVNGNSVAIDTSGDLGTYSIMHIGRRHDGTINTVLNGHIKSIQYYPRRLTNAQLVELTS